MDVEIKRFKSRPVIGIRRRIAKSDVGEFIKETFETVGQFFNSHGMQMTGPPVAIYYETTESEFDMAAGAPVKEVTATTDQIVELELIGGLKATTIHSGGYERLADTWDELIGKLEEDGLVTGMPCWEEYLTDPRREPDSAKWQTLLVEPVH
jgi:effector-binding domain-containing protein